MPSVRSVYLVGTYAKEITGNNLPTNRQVLSVLFYHMRSGKQDLHKSLRLAVKKVLFFWTKAHISTIDEYYCVRKVMVLYGEWKQLQKNCRCKSKSQLEKEEAYKIKLDLLFDIAHPHAMESMGNEEDKLFLNNQRAMKPLSGEDDGGKRLNTVACEDSSSEDELHESSDSIKTEESTFKYSLIDDGYIDNESVSGDDKDDMDITDIEIFTNEAELVRVDETPQPSTSLKFDLFGESITKHLQQLPLNVALKLQLEIQALVTQSRLEYIREHPGVVENETPIEEDAEESPSTRNNVQSCTEERPDKSRAKTFKRNYSSPGRNKSKPNNNFQQDQNKKAEYTTFGQHIALQLKQLPEEISVKLQSDIYGMIRQTYPQPVEENSPNRGKFKAKRTTR